jgi:hypothetical protein
LGKIDFGLLFDDTNERHVNVPDAASLDLAGDISLSAWVQTTDSDGSAAVIAAKWTGSGDRNYWLWKLDGTSLGFFVDDTQSVTANLSLINDGSWHLVTGVADGSGGLLRFFIDGIQRSTAAYDGTSQTGSSAFQIGSPDIPYDVGRPHRRGPGVGGCSPGGWVTTEFNSQNAPASFYTTGVGRPPPARRPHDAVEHANRYADAVEHPDRHGDAVEHANRYGDAVEHANRYADAVQHADVHSHRHIRAAGIVQFWLPQADHDPGRPG